MKRTFTVWKNGDVAVIRSGWGDAGMELQVVGQSVVVGRQEWVPVIDPDDGDPTFYKEACLQKKSVSPSNP